MNLINKATPNKIFEVLKLQTVKIRLVKIIILHRLSFKLQGEKGKTKDSTRFKV